MTFKRIKPEPKPTLDHFVKSVRIHDKWEHYHATIKRLFLADKIKGQEEFERQMGEWQLIIKKDQMKYGGSQMDAILRIGKALDGMSLAKLLSADYELIEGNDHCAKVLRKEASNV